MRRTAFGVAGSCLLVVAASIGCGGTNGGGLIAPDVDAAGAAASDGGSVIAPDGSGAPDSTVDGGGPDATVDARTDAPSDAPFDAPLDAPKDTSGLCDPPGSPLTLYVDPASGTDAPGSNGSGTIGGAPSLACTLKTITRGLALLPALAPTGTAIVVTVTSQVQAGETFPIPVPENVEIRAAGGAVVTVRVPAAASGFTFASSGSALRNLVLDGQAGLAQYGVVADTGADSALLGVDVSGFLLAGARAQGGTLAISGGTSLHENGTAAQPAPGLRVLASAVVTITGGTDAAPTSFSRNTGAGIDVRERGAIRVTGAVSSGGGLGAGTVLAAKNVERGVVIQQALVTLPPFPPASDLDGLVSSENGGTGLEIFGGSAVKVRNSVFVKNGGDGIRVAGNPSGTVGQDFDDVGRIDLGTSGLSTSYGNNVLQDTGAFNQGVGLCLALVNAPSSIAQTLQAAGNVFAASIDCSTTPATINKTPCSVARAPLGIEGLLDTINVSMCTLN